MSLRIIPCETCQGEGRLITYGLMHEPGCGHYHMGDVDRGPCPECEGACVIEAQVEPRTLSDLDDEDLEMMQAQMERAR